jgi:hypothetical protein
MGENVNRMPSIKQTGNLPQNERFRYRRKLTDNKSDLHIVATALSIRQMIVYKLQRLGARLWPTER